MTVDDINNFLLQVKENNEDFEEELKVVEKAILDFDASQEAFNHAMLLYQSGLDRLDINHSSPLAAKLKDAVGHGKPTIAEALAPMV